MSLHVEVIGRGEPLVMLHGWGMHGGIWHETAAKLAEQFEVHVVDLPGHGYSALPSPASGGGDGGEGNETTALPLTLSRKRERGLDFLETIVDQLSSQFDAPLAILGWSLGGIIALHWAAREPQQVKRLVLAASTPCFAARPDWECAMPQQTLAQFATELENNHAATLRRFLALQLRGSEQEREVLALLRERLFSRGEPDMAALRGGLNILRDADLRDALPQIHQPVLAIAGECDKLTPPQASHYLAQAMPNARTVEIEGAAHAPFLSHPQVFLDEVVQFLQAE